MQVKRMWEHDAQAINLSVALTRNLAISSHHQGMLEETREEASIALENLIKVISLLHEKNLLSDEEVLKHFLPGYEKV